LNQNISIGQAQKDYASVSSLKEMDMNWRTAFQKWTLHFPFKPPLNDNCLLLTFTDYETHQQETIQARYIDHNNLIFLFTREKWWRNFIDGSLVSVRFQGQQLTGVAFAVVSNRRAKSKILDYYLYKHPGEAVVFDLPANAEYLLDETLFQQATEQVVMIQIVLTTGYAACR
jgi:hypothetical protein